MSRQKKSKIMLESNIFDLWEEGVAIISSEGTITYTNKSWEEGNIAKIPEQLSAGTNYLSIRDSEGFVSPVIQGIKDVINGNIPFFRTEYSNPGPQQNCILIKARPLSTTYPSDVLIQQKDITSQKKVPRELERSERRFREVLENVTLISIMLDVEGRITFCNEHFLELTGWKREEVLNKKWFDLMIPPKLIPEIKIIFRKSIEKGEMPLFHENEILTRSGEMRLVRWYNTAFKNPQGKITGVTSIGEDITEKRETEEKLQQSTEIFRALYENAPLPYQSLDTDGYFLDVNPAWLNSLGYEKEEVIGKNFAEFIHPDWTDHFKKNFPEFKRIGHIHDIEFRMKHKKGHFLYVTFEGRVGYTKNGQFKQTYCVFKDITESRKVQMQLEESEQRFRQVYEHMAIGVARVSPGFKIESANRAYCSMLGYTEEELIGKHLADITHPEVLEENLVRQNRLAKGELDHFRMEKQFIHRSGAVIDGILDANLIRDSTGRPLYFLGSVVDITDRKRTEDALKESEEKFRSYIENAPDGIFVADERGNYVEVNRAASQITGYSKEELLSKKLTDIISPEDRPVAIASFQNVLKKGFTTDDVHFVTKQGETRIWNVTAAQISEKRYIGFTRDITEQMQALGEKKEIFDTFNTFMNLLPASVFIKDQSLRTRYVNKQMKELFGAGEWLDLKPEEIFPAEIGRSMKEDDIRALEEGYTVLEEDVPDLQGNIHTYWTQKFRIDRDAKEPLLGGIALDITKRKEYEKRIDYLTSILSSIRNVNQLIVKEKDRVLLAQGICDNLTDNHGYYSAWICLLDENGNPDLFKEKNAGGPFAQVAAQLEKGNLPYCARRGLEEDSYLIISEPERTCSNCPLANQYESSVALVSKLDYNNRIYGTITTAIPAEFAEDPEVLDLFIEVTQDISFALYSLELERARQKTELSLLHSKLAAEQANRTKTEFLANMSHELRTPLNSIIGFSQILKTAKYGGLNEEQDRFISNVLKSGRHLLELINDILDISRIESGNLKYEPENLNISSLLKETIVIIQPVANNKDLDVIYDIRPEELYVYADPVKIREIMYNLLSNAIKFTPEKGRIEVISKLVNDHIQISVSDSGIGIPRTEHKNIFDPFKQVDSALNRKYSGTGLGLALVKKYVQMHNGDIRVDSEPGKGSTFTFRLPVNE